jgi:hypothetical protein
MENNKKEFIELLEKYKAITIRHIEDSIKRWGVIEGYCGFGFAVMFKLTGFGSFESCKLCIEASELYEKIPQTKGWFIYLCNYCYWKTATLHKCSHGKNENSYDAIHNAKNKTELFEAIQMRIERMEDVLNGKQ